MVKADSEEAERYTPEQVDYSFAGVYAVSDSFRNVLSKGLSELPKDVVDWATENLFFVSSSEEFYAFSLAKAEWKHKTGFVFLSDNLKELTEERQAFIIAHEIAHHKLRHKNPIFNRLTEKEAAKQEWEADTLAEEWLSSFTRKEREKQ